MTDIPAGTHDDALFRTLIATAVDGIIVIDERGAVSIYNAACERLFGYQQDEVIGKNVKLLMPSPYRDEHDGYLKHYRSTGEKRIIGSGAKSWASARTGPPSRCCSPSAKASSAGRGFLSASSTISPARATTERRMQDLQNELLHVSRLSAMGQMTAAIAHELNQPLTAILNYINAARRTMSVIGDPRASRVAELIDKAASQTSRAGQIIRQLRDFVEKRESARVEANLNSVVEEAIALASVGSADANVKTIVELAPGLPLVLIDKIQVQQVVINLVRNSVEAMQAVARRELRVTTSHDPESGVVVSVSDTGRGLPPEVASRLFHPFVTTKEKGMGIGLSICHSIVEAHGGRIWAAPNEKGGASFHFSLPAAEPAEDTLE